MTEPLLPETTSDEQEIGWGDDLDDVERDSDEQLRQDRPPHYDQD